MNNTNDVTSIVLLMFVAVLLFAGIGLAMSKVEASECAKWQQQSEEYSDFYWTDWQIEQCKK